MSSALQITVLYRVGDGKTMLGLKVAASMITINTIVVAAATASVGYDDMVATWLLKYDNKFVFLRNMSGN